MKKLKKRFERAALLLLALFIMYGGSYAAMQGNWTSLPEPTATSAAYVAPVALKMDEPAPIELLEEPVTPIPPPVVDAPLGEAETAALISACEEYGIDLPLALGLIFVESSFIPDAVSSEGCYGLCQLNPAYFPSDLAPAENIKAGMRFLGELLDKYQDVPAALTAYNAGHDTGDRTYANAVLAAAEDWR